MTMEKQKSRYWYITEGDKNNIKINGLFKLRLESRVARIYIRESRDEFTHYSTFKVYIEFNDLVDEHLA